MPAVLRPPCLPRLPCLPNRANLPACLDIRQLLEESSINSVIIFHPTNEKAQQL